MSAIKQEVRRTWRELKKSCADATASTLYPSDLMRPFIASRIESSSSTIEISGFAFGTRPPAPRACDGNDGTRSKALWRRVVFTASQKMRRTRAPGDYTLVWTELSRGRIHSCAAPRTVSERYLRDLLIAARGGEQPAETTLACRCQRRRASLPAKGNSPSFLEHAILGCPKWRITSAGCGASIAAGISDDRTADHHHRR